MQNWKKTFFGADFNYTLNYVTGSPSKLFFALIERQKDA
jgi:hypothetical protein